MAPEGFAVVLVAATVGLVAILMAGTADALARVRRSKNLGVGTSRYSQATAPGDGPLAATMAKVAGGAAAVFLVWAGLSLLLSAQGAFASSGTTRFPWIGVGIALPVAAGLLLLGSSAAVRRLVDAVPLPRLIGVQLYRVLGAVFVLAYLEHRMPGPFALPAGIGDVAVGLAAPFVAYALAKGLRPARWLAVAWNVAGVADLVMAVSLGFATSPSAFELLAKGSPNALITRWPFVLIPVFAVPVSILLHAAALRRLGPAAAVNALPVPAATSMRRPEHRLSA